LLSILARLYGAPPAGSRGGAVVCSRRACVIRVRRAVKIRYSQPVAAGRELDYLRQALEQGHLSSDGPFTQRCEAWLGARLGNPRVRLTNSATAALELAALLAQLAPGDEVIMPAFTFVSCANAVALRGATPVFVDVRPDTLNIDPAEVRGAVTPRTRGIVAVHYGGVPCDMDAIMDLATQHGLVVIEDAAQALMSSYRGRPAGTLGHLGALSFHDTKNVMCGEGGAIVVNDARFADRAEVAHMMGTDRAAFRRGLRSHYSWIDLGSSHAPGEITAAVLLAQLERAEEITRSRLDLWTRYHRAFAALEDAGVVRRPVIPDDVQHNGHLYYLLLADEKLRDRFIAAMRERGISTPFHYVPLDDSPGGRRYARAHGGLPVTHSAAGRLVRLPAWFGMGAEPDRVIEAVFKTLGQIA
jgi:dTDP-4-amino-4,6-dideoxygalactose transaminase